MSHAASHHHVRQLRSVYMYPFEYDSCLYSTLLFYLLCGVSDNNGQTGANMSKASTACLASLVLYMICSYVVCVCMSWQSDACLGFSD